MYFQFAAMLRTSRDAAPIYVAQRVLVEVEARCRASGSSLAYGLLVGEVCAEPKTEREYVLIDGAMHAQAHSTVSDDPDARVAANLESLAGEAIGQGRVPLGWYRNVTSIAAAKARQNAAFYHDLFAESWHVMLALEAGASARGAFVRVEPADGHAYTAPFFELLPAGARAKGGKLGTVVRWENYRTEVPIAHLEKPDPPTTDVRYGTAHGTPAPNLEGHRWRGIGGTLASLRGMLRQLPERAPGRIPQPSAAGAAVARATHARPSPPPAQPTTVAPPTMARANAAPVATGAGPRRGQPTVTFPMLVPPRPPWAVVRSRTVLQWGAAALVAGVVIAIAFFAYRLAR